MIKFKDMPNYQHITYRLCDVEDCRQIARHVHIYDKGPNVYERHLCESHYLQYKMELKDNAKSNS
jgi:hypothetical protein